LTPYASPWSRGTESKAQTGGTGHLARRALAGVTILVLAASCGPAFGWGSKGHQWTTDNAVELLPAGKLKDFMVGHRSALAYNCLVPDFQLKEGVSGKIEAPDHYLDLEIISPQPKPSDIPRTRLDAARLYTMKGIPYASGGFLPWRIEETFWALANAMRCDVASVPFWAGLIAHYAADATQPLHATVRYDGLPDPANPGQKLFKGIHLDYEVTFLEDEGFEFRRSSLALAARPATVTDVHDLAARTLCDSFGHVNEIYDAARRHWGPTMYADWERELGPMTRGQLAKASTLIASLWLTAWEVAGSPAM
jgi:hypothetical protein